VLRRGFWPPGSAAATTFATLRGRLLSFRSSGAPQRFNHSITNAVVRHRERCALAAPASLSAGSSNLVAFGLTAGQAAIRLQRLSAALAGA
jgi:uncharacterized membrane protein